MGLFHVFVKSKNGIESRMASQTEIKYEEALKRHCDVDRYQCFNSVNCLQNPVFLLTKFDIKIES